MKLLLDDISVLCFDYHSLTELSAKYINFITQIGD